MCFLLLYLSIDSEDNYERNWKKTTLPGMTSEHESVKEKRARRLARESSTRHVWTIMVERQGAHISSVREAHQPF